MWNCLCDISGAKNENFIYYPYHIDYSYVNVDENNSLIDKLNMNHFYTISWNILK